jgi:hypothetical protein
VSFRAAPFRFIASTRGDREERKPEAVCPSLSPFVAAESVLGSREEAAARENVAAVSCAHEEASRSQLLALDLRTGTLLQYPDGFSVNAAAVGAAIDEPT